MGALTELVTPVEPSQSSVGTLGLTTQRPDGGARRHDPHDRAAAADGWVSVVEGDK
jgi:hypothetical protein